MRSLIINLISKERSHDAMSSDEIEQILLRTSKEELLILMEKVKLLGERDLLEAIYKHLNL